MILVKRFVKRSGLFSTGLVEILYWDMTLLCDIIVFKTRDGVYIKIPQKVDDAGKKINVLHWVSPEISDAFQEEVKKQLAEKFPEALIIPKLEDAKKKFKLHRMFFKNKTRRQALEQNESFEEFVAKTNLEEKKVLNK